MRTSIAIMILWAIFSLRGMANPIDGIVDVKHQLYTYEKLLSDIDSLQKCYPECIDYELRDTTCQGCQLVVAYFGNRDAQNHIMVQASMHAREYMSAQLVMAILEYYATRYKDGKIDGIDYCQLFNEVCFVIIPMVNPDGVTISQFGEEGAVTDDVKEWIRCQTIDGKDYKQMKSNARGIDLNRNFSNGFGEGSVVRSSKSYDFYHGVTPYSENETKLMLKVSQQYDYSCFLNYHTSGNVIYYGCRNAKHNVNSKALQIAQIIKRRNNYILLGPKYQKTGGSWGDEVEVLYQRPSVTIEIGTKNPVPISEFNKIYNKNVMVWADLASAVLKGQI